MTKIIDIAEEPEKPEPEKPIFDHGFAADEPLTQPMTLAQLEAKLPAFQRPKKLLKLPYLSPEAYDQRERAADAKANARGYRGRAGVGSSAHRAAQRVRSCISADGLSTRGAYGSFKDALADDPKPTYQAAPETTMGYCRECNRAIPRVGMRADAKFCCEAHSKAFRRKEALRHEANKAFRNHYESAAAKAEAELSDEAYRIAALQMSESAARAGIDGATFFATPSGVMGRVDEALPPARFWSIANIDHPHYGPFPTEIVIEVQATPVPEYGATLFSFTFPALPQGAIGRLVALTVRFLGDPGTGWGDEYLTPEQEEAEAR
jgi:hypothetical protein